MTAIKLAGGVLRVPTHTVLPDGVHIDSTRDITPDDPDYQEWLPYAIDEADSWHGDPDDETILSRWRAAASA
ncbi:unnamed protein product [[Actinomadura] parvosata subsp. kistnae]|uniref:hypothetical protein n=1 Tax=[Actinomadura] parvosata TaxID=1955412 RepID=UPI000D27CD6C|nr:unnamed protein product [Actinomadura parvosata subsp. kistnae]